MKGLVKMTKYIKKTICLFIAFTMLLTPAVFMRSYAEDIEPTPPIIVEPTPTPTPPIDENAEKLIAIALQELGQKEKPLESNKIKYNNWYYGKYKANKYSYAWCAVFVTWCFNELGLDYKAQIGNANQTKGWVRYAKEKNSWIAKENLERGDIICFSGWANTTPSHIGIVMEREEDTLKVIEGNSYSDETFEKNISKIKKGKSPEGIGVYIRTREVEGIKGAYRVLGGFRPLYTLPPVTKTYPALKKGSRGSYVKKAQKLLKKKKISVGKIDGYFGAKTKRGVIKFQKRNKIKANGIIGKSTWNKLLK